MDGIIQKLTEIKVSPDSGQAALIALFRGKVQINEREVLQGMVSGKFRNRRLLTSVRLEKGKCKATTETERAWAFPGWMPAEAPSSRESNPVALRQAINHEGAVGCGPSPRSVERGAAAQPLATEVAGVTRWRWGFLIAGLGAIAVEPALGQMPIPVAETVRAQPVQLSLNDRINVRRIEDYLNSIKTVRARFRQVSSSGDVADGYLYIQRPGRIRVEYDPPVPILIVSDGSFLIYYDRQLEQVTYLPLSSTPASVLTRDHIALRSGDVMITGFEQYEDTLRLTLVLRADPKAGSITLVFDPNPVHLKMWSITDALGVVTDVSLTQTDFDLQFEQYLFQFRRD